MPLRLIRQCLPSGILVQHFAAGGAILTVVPSGNGRHEPPTPRVTRSNRAPPIWLGDDPVAQLRQWATEVVYSLPDAPVSVIGTSPEADVRLIDPTRSVSRKHARIEHTPQGWRLVDLRSRNGISFEGSRPQAEFMITPGMEISIGELTLVAENRSVVLLRDYVGRILGRSPASWLAIDLAMRAIRNAAYRRAQLVLVSAEDIVSIARQIHLRTTPRSAAFVVCGTRLYDADANVRVTARLTDAKTALGVAAGGTVCVRHYKPPKDYEHLIDKTLEPLSATQMYICAKKVPSDVPLLKTPIIVPRVTARSADIPNVVAEYADDAIRELRADSSCFTERERDWIADHASTFTEVEIATLWTVARNFLGSASAAAERLGLPGPLLRDWFNRRKGL